MEWIQVINCAIEYMEQHLLEDGAYKISGYKSVPAFRPGPKDMANKWITLYAYMAKEDRPLAPGTSCFTGRTGSR